MRCCGEYEDGQSSTLHSAILHLHIHTMPITIPCHVCKSQLIILLSTIHRSVDILVALHPQQLHRFGEGLLVEGFREEVALLLSGDLLQQLDWPLIVFGFNDMEDVMENAQANAMSPHQVPQAG